MLALLTALGTLAPVQVEARWLADADRAAILAAIESLGAPCRFRVELREVWMPWSDPALAGSHGSLLVDAATQGAVGTLSMRAEELLTACDAVAADVCGRAGGDQCRGLDVQVVDLGSEKLQRTSGELTADTQGQYRCAAFNLVYENYRGRDQILRAYAPGASPLMYDLDAILAPLPVGARAAASMRGWTWELVDAPDPAVLALRHVDTQAGESSVRLEVARETHLPLAVSWHKSASVPDAALATVFRYSGRPAPDGRPSGQVFPADVLAFMRGADTLVVGRFRISQFEYDVGPEVLALHVIEGTQLIDERTDQPVRYTEEAAEWPKELASVVAFHPELEPRAADGSELAAEAFDGDHEHPQPAPPSGRLERSLPWIGGGLIAAGILGLLGSRRRKATPPS